MKKYLPTLRDYFFITLSALIQAFSLRTFFIPANLASGGVSGIAQLINHFTGWQIGLMILIGNVRFSSWAGVSSADIASPCGRPLPSSPIPYLLICCRTLRSLRREAPARH